MKKKASLSIGGVLLAIVAAFFLPGDKDQPRDVGAQTGVPTAADVFVGGLPASASKVGFTSRRNLVSHFEKHGHEFGKITQDEYLARAKALRDAPLSETVLELTRTDGVITRFDQRGGGFVAFHKDKSIRTYFRPNDGVSYFRRQARR